MNSIVKGVLELIPTVEVGGVAYGAGPSAEAEVTSYDGGAVQGEMHGGVKFVVDEGISFAMGQAANFLPDDYGWQAGIDGGIVFKDERIGGFGMTGVSANVDTEGTATHQQAGLDFGPFFSAIRENGSRVRHEGGLTANADQHLDRDGSGGSQTGLDLGLFTEFDDYDPTGTSSFPLPDARGEAGLTANSDIQLDAVGSGGQMGQDLGLFAEGRSNSGDMSIQNEDRVETGLTGNIDWQNNPLGDGEQMMLDIGLFDESDSGRREETGVTIGLQTFDNGGVGVFAGVYAENNSGRAQYGVGVNTGL